MADEVAETVADNISTPWGKGVAKGPIQSFIEAYSVGKPAYTALYGKIGQDQPDVYGKGFQEDAHTRQTPEAERGYSWDAGYPQVGPSESWGDISTYGGDPADPSNDGNVGAAPWGSGTTAVTTAPISPISAPVTTAVVGSAGEDTFSDPMGPPDSMGGDDNSDCFITMAIVEHIGEEDDGPTLTTLRHFRDTYLLGNPIVEEYYNIAPTIVERLNAMPNHENIYRRLNQEYIQPAVDCIKDGCFADALDIYTEMVTYTKELTDGYATN